MTLTSLPEKNALKIEALNNFQDFHLLSFKKDITELLSLIGKNGNGIFLTYTKHDISHINSLLGMAEWLIPEKTMAAMTSVDWLLIVLSCYLHDLGMITTDEEYENRTNNQEYIEFESWIKNDIKAEDYRNRVSFSPDPDKFYFQEYIRHTHAKRIKEWILNINKKKWPSGIREIAQTISSSLSKLPPRFISDLAIVCESHHLNDLHKEDKYPLYQTYGNSTQESANVQYAAVILRTLDLLHMTKDRTPSIMYKTLQITDPLGIKEWEKQLGTYSVLPASRTLTDDPETHIISVTADFTNERAFFSLSEYLSFADGQIKQSKGWINESKEKNNGAKYEFPWHSIKGNIKVEGNEPIPLKFELDRGKLLDLLVGHTIYNEPSIVVRELLQNAIDATRYKAYKNKNSSYSGLIKTIWDNSNKELTIIDNGTGMDRAIITGFLMKVGSSYYNTTEFKIENSEFSSISKFGIGVLTCFMVSDDIEIITKKDKSAYRIRMTSVHSNYLLKELEQNNPILNDIKQDGTIVKLKLRSSVNLKRSIEDIIRYWIIFPESQVLYIEDNNPPIEIGFKNIKEAFEYYHLKNKNTNIEENIDIISDAKNIGNEKYEIAYGIYKKMINMPTFYEQRRDAPTICLEGIRVSNSFKYGGISGIEAETYYPGDSGIAAIVSIKNNTRIRTTVSRNGLERDNEYEQILEHCISFFLKRIKEEVTTIINLPESPYSRASVTAEWMLDLVSETILSQKTIEDFHFTLPTIIFEETKDDPKIVVKKKIISKSEMKGIDFFYTMESRILQYLSILSKDLGRELGYNSFIANMAPELMDNRISPLLIHNTSYDQAYIYDNYQPDIVTYSIKQQKVTIRWKKNIRDKNILKLIPNINEDRILRGKINVAFGNEIIDSYGSKTNRFDNIFAKVKTCDITGDKDNITAVTSNTYIFLSTNSNAYKIWNLLTSTLEKALNEKYENDIYVLLGYIHLYYKINMTHKHTTDGNKLLLYWKSAESKLKNILEKFNMMYSNELLFGNIKDNDEWFNASSYWVNWH